MPYIIQFQYQSWYSSPPVLTYGRKTVSELGLRQTDSIRCARRWRTIEAARKYINRHHLDAWDPAKRRVDIVPIVNQGE